MWLMDAFSAYEEISKMRGTRNTAKMANSNENDIKAKASPFGSLMIKPSKSRSSKIAFAKHEKTDTNRCFHLTLFVCLFLITHPCLLKRFSSVEL